MAFPGLKVGEDLDVIDSEGRWKKVAIDDTTIKRLQYAAYFELKAALSLMTDAQISRIQDTNPKFRNDIEIIRKVLKSEKRMLSVPEKLAGAEVLTYRQKLADQALADYALLKNTFRQKGFRSAFLETGKVTWVRGHQLEDWFQRRAVDKLLQSERGKAYLPYFHQMRQGVNEANEHLLGSKWMMRLDGGNSIIEILKTYIREGELNAEVGKTALFEGISFLPFMGTLFSVQSGVEGVSTLILVQLVPGYGQLLLTGNMVKGLVEIGGLMIFEPLKRDRVLLAYQGYLDPQEDSWWWPFASDVKERVVSPRPHLLLPVDRDMKLNLEERRDKMYAFFHSRAIAHLKHDYGISGDEPIPPELAMKEYEYVDRHIENYVNHWWNGTGPIFGEYDVLTVHRGEDIRPDLIRKLKKDYLTGKNRALQEEMLEREEKMEQLQYTYEEVASEGIVFDQVGKGLKGEYARAGSLFVSHILETMPSIKSSIEIIVAPYVIESDNDVFDHLIDRMNFRAKVTASLKEHPGPWSIVWEVEKPQAPGRSDGSGSMKLSQPQKEVEAAGEGMITVTAIAMDKAGNEFVRGSIQLEVEKEEVVKDEEDELDPSEKKPEEEAENDLIEQMEELVSKAAAESAKVEQECVNGEGAAEKAGKDSERLGEELEGIQRVAASLMERIDALTNAFEKVDTLKRTIDDAALTLAEKRDRIRKSAVTICIYAVDVRKAKSEEERNRLIAKARDEMKSLKQLHAEVKLLYQKIQSALRKLKAIEEERKALMLAVDQFDKEMIELAKRKFDVRTQESNSKANHSEAEIYVGKLEETKTAGQKILQAGQAIKDPELQQQLDQLFGRIAASKSRVEACPVPLGEDLEEIDRDLTQFDERYNAVDNNMNDAMRNVDFNVLLIRLSIALEDGESVLAVADLFMESIEKMLEDGQTCLDNAEDALQNPITVVVPSLKELSLNEARRTLKEAGLKTKVIPGSIALTKAQSLTVENQEPGAGTRVRLDTLVKIKIYSPYKEVLTVPDLRGKSKEIAREMLKGDFILAVEEGDSAPSLKEEGTVQSQVPAPYSELEKGGTVNVKLYTSYKPERTVPDVTGLYVYDAVELIGKAGFKFVKIAGEEAPNKENEGVVYQQTPNSAVKVDSDLDTVKITYYKKMKGDAPILTSDDKSRESFYVVFNLYFPKVPTDIPEGDQAKDYLIKYLKALPLSEKSFVHKDGQEALFYFHSEALGTFKRGQFTPGSKFASPFSIDFKNEKGESFKLKGAFLMQVARAFTSFEEMSAVYPEVKKGAGSGKVTSYLFEVDNSDGMYALNFAEMQGEGKFTGGPIYKGWPQKQMRQNIEFMIVIVELFDCFIATAVYRATDNEQLTTLREFRDDVLSKSDAGRRLIKFYYRYGPKWAVWVYNKPVAASLIRIFLNGTVWVLDKVDMDDPKTAKYFQPFIDLADWMFNDQEEEQKND